MRIPKIIHLCWFGKGSYPPLAEMCIKSWKTLLPEYEIMLWNEESFDVGCCSYTKKAYEEGRWAFVSDYARLKVLYEYGGVYMDTDLEVIQNFSHLLEGRQFVSSYIEGGLITAGFIACVPHHPFVRALLDHYDEASAKLDRGEEIPFVMNPLIYTSIAMEKYDFRLTDLCMMGDEVTIYPLEYFMPYKKYAFGSDYGRWHYRITAQTCTIHHDMSSWHKGRKIKKMIAAAVRAILPQKQYIAMKIRKNLKSIAKAAEQQ